MTVVSGKSKSMRSVSDPPLVLSHNMTKRSRKVHSHVQGERGREERKGKKWRGDERG